MKLKPERVWDEETGALRFLFPMVKIDVPSRDAVGKMNKFLHPDVAKLFNTLPDGIEISDMWRSGKGSYLAIKRGRPAAKPGNSGHNWGMSIDLDLRQTMKNWNIWKSKCFKGWQDKMDEVRRIMAKHGWCWIRHSKGLEEWHFNGLGIGVENLNGFYSVKDWVESHWELELADDELQGALKQCSIVFQDKGMNPGKIDGWVGPKTRRAMARYSSVTRFGLKNKRFHWSLMSVCGEPTLYISEESEEA